MAMYPKSSITAEPDTEGGTEVQRQPPENPPPPQESRTYNDNSGSRSNISMAVLLLCIFMGRIRVQ